MRCVRNIQDYSLQLGNKLYINADVLLVSSSDTGCSDWWMEGRKEVASFYLLWLLEKPRGEEREIVCARNRFPRGH